MPRKLIGRAAILKQYITREWRTINLDHVKPHFKRDLRPNTDPRRRPFNLVPLKDRIKWWNIVPGDQVRVRGLESEGVREVLAVSKFQNRVYLRHGKQPNEDAKDDRGDFVSTSESVHYSRCQLLVGRYLLAKKNESDVQESVNIFAKRVATSRPTWHKFTWQWQRYAAALTPRPPEGAAPDGRVLIPWPIRPAPNFIPPVTIYDTQAEEVQKETWSPPKDLIHPSKERVKDWADRYLEYLASPEESSKLHGLPFEFLCADELANPHSRAIKQRRWQEALQERKKERVLLIRSHIRSMLHGTGAKSRPEAIAEAEYKFRQIVLNRDRAKRKKRWIQSGGQQKLLAKQQKKARKARRLIAKMNQLTLEPGPNQFIPPTPIPYPSQSSLEL